MLHFLFLLSGIAIGIILIFIANTYCKRFIRKRAFERGWGWYNPENGKFEWTNDEAHYVFTGFFHFPAKADAIATEVFSISGKKLRTLADTAMFKRQDIEKIKELATALPDDEKML